MSSGGARKGAGRKPTGPTRREVHICLTRDADKYFQMIPRGRRSAVVSTAIIGHLKLCRETADIVQLLAGERT
jgi:hypothetical protein